MVKYNEKQLNAVFHALSDPTRRAMLKQLAAGECTVSQLADPFRMSLPAVSKHLKALEKAGLIKRRIAGRQHYCQLTPKTLADVHDWLSFYSKFWQERLDALGALMQSETEKDRK
ncbi:MAG: metalloregulator ArsR/SmtB family transcription factor [Gammaproteobacteria bacterium]|nr:metalloregulator ArsR/SmtB family transcription factor [Gammaproteobacteria bacterium]